MSAEQQKPSEDQTILKIAQEAFVTHDAKLQGSITFGSGTVVHPKAVIKAGAGAIVFGTNNIIEETALVEHTGPPGTVFEIGNDNLFEVGSVCRAQKVGDNNTFGVKCEIGEGVEISNGCSIGAKCKLLMKETLPPHTVIYGEQNQRRMAADNPLGLKSQTDFLRSSLTRYSKAIRNKE